MEKNIKDEELFIPKTKHKALKIILAVFLLVGIMALGYFIYKDKFNNPNKIVTDLIQDAEKEALKAINETDKNNKYQINGLVKFNVTMPGELSEITNIINNIDLQFNGEIDEENHIGNVTLNTKYKNNQLLDIKSYYEKDNIYLLLEGIYDKYLKLPTDNTSDEIIEIPQVTIEKKDIEVLFNTSFKAIKDALGKLDFKRESTTIKINNKDQNVYNNYVILNGAELKTLIKNILNNLAEQNEFTTLFKKKTNFDFKEELEKMYSEIDAEQLNGTYKINFYTNKNMLNSKLVSVRLEVVEDGVTSSINIDKIADDEIIISINMLGASLSCQMKKNNSAINATLNANITGMTLKINFNFNYEKINNITKPDISNSKNIEDLTEDEKREIEEKIQNNQGLSTFIQDVSKFTIIP